MTPGAPDRPGADRWVPESADLEALRTAVHECRGCELWRPATQAVFSDGPATARVVLVGEQPGDREDREGEPFVGPAGAVLDDALEHAGVRRSEVYVTNAVKHFRFDERGPRRLHKKPGVAHVRACLPWLTAELALVRPQVVVCLGATAARAVLDRAVTIGDVRGRPLTPEHLGTTVVVTAHPSSVLRLRGREGFRDAFDALVADLRTVGDLLA